jgi:hypothetical protein
MQIESLSIEDLAALRDRVLVTLTDKVAARQKVLLESERVGALVTSKPSTARPKRPVKYRDGQNEWSGCGTPPAWAKAKGETLESYRVSKTRLAAGLRA